MRHIRALKAALFGGVALAALAGCSTNWDLDKIAALPNQGGQYDQALQQAYLERARFEAGQVNWASVDYFAERAKQAAAGNPPPLQPLNERHFPKTVTNTRDYPLSALTAAHTRLSSALASGAASRSPVACANAQAWLEQWMEQQEEGFQPDHIAAAREGFNEWMPRCVPGAQAFEILFPFDSADLTPTAQGKIQAIVKAVRSQNAKSVTVSGYADRAGAEGYNQELAQARATAVSKALEASGVTVPVRVASFGENRPQVPTADGVKELRNRRVEVTVN